MLLSETFKISHNVVKWNANKKLYVANVFTEYAKLIKIYIYYLNNVWKYPTRRALEEMFESSFTDRALYIKIKSKYNSNFKYELNKSFFYVSKDLASYWISTCMILINMAHKHVTLIRMIKRNCLPIRTGQN